MTFREYWAKLKRDRPEEYQVKLKRNREHIKKIREKIYADETLHDQYKENQRARYRKKKSV